MATTETPTLPQEIHVVDEHGNIGTLPLEEARDAIKNGVYRPATAQDLQELSDQKVYGEGVLNPLKAGAEAAAGTATFGLSRQLENASGLTTPEAQAQRAKRNPIASNVVGPAVGILGPLFAPELEAGALGDLANPVKALSKVGSEISDSVSPFAQKAASALANPETSPVVNKIVAKAISRGAGSAVEAAAYGLGQAVNEDALGDLNALGEKLLSHVGWGAAFGGGLGSLVGLAGEAVPGALGKARESMGRLLSLANGETGEVGVLGKAYAKASSFVSGKPEEEIIEALKKRSLSLTTPEEQVHLAEGFAKGLQDQHEALEAEIKKVYKDVKPEETEKLLKHIPTDLPKAQFNVATQEIDSLISKMRSDPDLYPGFYARKLEEVRDGVLRRAPGEAANSADIFKSLNKFKQELDTNIKYGKMPSPAEAEAQAAITQLKRTIQKGLEDESVWSHMGARQAAFNDAFNAYKNIVEAPKAFQSQFMYKTVTRSGKIAYKIDPAKVRSFFSQINDARGTLKSELLQNYLKTANDLTNQIEKTYESAPSQAFDKQTLTSLIEKNKAQTESAMEQAKYNKTLSSLGAGAHNTSLLETGAVFAGMHNPALGAGIEAWNLMRAPGLAIQRLAKIERAAQSVTSSIQKGASAIFKVSGALARPFEGYAGSRLSPAESMAQYKKNADQVAKVNTGIENMMDKLDQSTRDVYVAAPKTAFAVQSGMIRGAQFLAQKMPKEYQAGPLSRKMPPSQAEISKFNSYFHTVENPTSVLSSVSAGMLIPEQMETLSAVYPSLLKEMRSQVMDKLMDEMAKPGFELSHRKKTALSMFLGQDLVGSLNPISVQANQQAMNSLGVQQARVDGNAMTKVTQTGLGKLSAGSRLLTNMQTTAQRETS